VQVVGRHGAADYSPCKHSARLLTVTCCPADPARSTPARTCRRQRQRNVRRVPKVITPPWWGPYPWPWQRGATGQLSVRCTHRRQLRIGGTAIRRVEVSEPVAGDPATSGRESPARRTCTAKAVLVNTYAAGLAECRSGAANQGADLQPHGDIAIATAINAAAGWVFCLRQRQSLTVQVTAPGALRCRAPCGAQSAVDVRPELRHCWNCVRGAIFASPASPATASAQRHLRRPHSGPQARRLPTARSRATKATSTPARYKHRKRAPGASSTAIGRRREKDRRPEGQTHFPKIRCRAYFNCGARPAPGTRLMALDLCVSGSGPVTTSNVHAEGGSAHPYASYLGEQGSRQCGIVSSRQAIFFSRYRRIVPPARTCTGAAMDYPVGGNTIYTRLTSRSRSPNCGRSPRRSDITASRSKTPGSARKARLGAGRQPETQAVHDPRSPSDRILAPTGSGSAIRDLGV